MSTYNGWQIVTIPTAPVAPASLEVNYVSLVGTTTSPFSGQQQVQSWSNSGYFEVSASYAAMTLTQGQLWAAFLTSLNGPACVFQFPSTLSALFPVELQTSGEPTYWRLKGNSVHWTIREGQLYAVTFECRTAL